VSGSGLRVPAEELSFQYARSGGAGGQNVNKVSSKAILRWRVAESRALPGAVRERFLARFASRITGEGELVLASDRFRDRGRNVADCVERLHAMLAEVARPPTPRRPTKPGRGAKERRLGEKRRASEKKQLRGRRFED
jgi:ribosome-associated protein